MLKLCVFAEPKSDRSCATIRRMKSFSDRRTDCPDRTEPGALSLRTVPLQGHQVDLYMAGLSSRGFSSQRHSLGHSHIAGPLALHNKPHNSIIIVSSAQFALPVFDRSLGVRKDVPCLQHGSESVLSHSEECGAKHSEKHEVALRVDALSHDCPGRNLSNSIDSSNVL